MEYEDVDPKIANLLYEIKKNQLKMVERRGYNIDRERQILQLTAPQFINAYIPFAQQQNKTFRSVLTQVYENDEGKKLLVYYADIPSNSSQLGVNELGDAIRDMDHYNLKDAIIITPKQLSSQSEKHISGLVAYNIQIFLEDEMAYDPTEHFLVPTHIPLDKTQQREFFEKNDISFDQLPILLTNDIIARYYGLRGGQVVRIERTNLYQTMVINSVAYRAVKEP